MLSVHHSRAAFTEQGERDRGASLVVNHRRRAWLVIGVMLGVALCPLPLTGQNREDEFLGALRDAGYHDLAAYYLDQAGNRASLSPSIKSQLVYERAILLFESSNSMSGDERQQRLDEARKLFEKFATENPSHPQAGAAGSWLAKVLLQQASLMSASVPAAAASKQPAIRKQAVKLFKQAQTAFNKRQKELENELEAINQQSADQQDPAQRDSKRADFLQAKLSHALTYYEIVKLERDDPEQFGKYLGLAKKRLTDIADKYRDRLVGLEAMYYLGRVEEESGDLTKALSVYEDLLRLKTLPEEISAKTLTRAMICWLDDSVGQVARTVDFGNQWISENQPGDQSVSAAPVRVQLSRALIATAGDGKGREPDRMREAAREHLLLASRIAGDHQATARTLLADLRVAGVGAAAADEMRQFEDAKRNADQLRQEMQSSQMLVQLQQRNLETTEDPDRRREIETQLAEAKSNEAQLQTETLNYYQRALELADETTDVDQLNEARYVVAFLRFKRNDLYDAAVLGEYVARRFPQHTVAKECANLAMAAYWQLFQAAPDDDRAFEIKHLIAIADYVASRWPGGKEAEDALSNLVGFMIAEDRLTEAEAYLDQIPTDSPRRADAELRTGQALWRHYLQKSEAADAASSESEWAQLKEKAAQFLTSGIEHSRNREPDRVLAQAVLSAAQLSTYDNQCQRALDLITDARFGPKTLIDKGDPIADVPGFIEQTYKALLRAQIGSLSVGANAAPVLAEAVKTMDSLKKAVGDSPAGQQRLVATYVGLASDLQQQIERTPPAGRAKLSAGFEVFLDRVADSSDQLNLQNWVAETYFGLAEGLDNQDAAAPPQAGKYFAKSRDTFAKLLPREDLSPDAAIQIELRMAHANRRIGEHKQAIDLFERVLRKKNSLISVQVDAARTYQEAAPYGNVNLFDRAIKGGRADESGKNVIWGWEKISQIASAQMQRDEANRNRFEPVFFEKLA